MKIDNKTIYHDNFIKKVVNFVMPPLVRYAIDNSKLRIEIKIRTGNGATGQSSCSRGRCWDVYIQVPYIVSKYPYREMRGGTSETDRKNNRKYRIINSGDNSYIPTFILTREEHLLHCIAHELRHIAQHLAGALIDVTNAKEILPKEVAQDIPEPEYSDKDADRYAIRKQREWRKLYNQPIYQELPQQLLVT